MDVSSPPPHPVSLLQRHDFHPRSVFRLLSRFCSFWTVPRVKNFRKPHLQHFRRTPATANWGLPSEHGKPFPRYPPALSMMVFQSPISFWDFLPPQLTSSLLIHDTFWAPKSRRILQIHSMIVSSVFRIHLFPIFFFFRPVAGLHDERGVTSYHPDPTPLSLAVVETRYPRRPLMQEIGFLEATYLPDPPHPPPQPPLFPPRLTTRKSSYHWMR